MAEAIAFNVAAKIIESLGSLALKEIGKLWGVTDEFEKLKNTLSTIQAVLLDAEEKQWAANNHEETDWLEKLKDLVYDVDDLLDGFSTDCLLREMPTSDKMPKKVRTLLSKSQHLFDKLKMGHKIKAIRQKLDAISNDHKKFQLEGRLGEIGVKPRKRDDTHSLVLEAEVIGREDAKKEIIDILLSDSDIKGNVGILPITGIGGLGKTTLAQLIFNDLEVDKHFQLKMWVCVSDNFDVRKVVEKIIESATNKKPESVQMNTLVHGLQKEIGGKKYLLVLDDVWNEDFGKWNELKELLMSGASGSRILVTTLSEKVAGITKTIFEPYSLQGLDSEKSWRLFKKLAFENGEEPENYKKVEVGKRIVEKCSGVPLVIITIGRLLSLENSEARWDSFEKNKMPKIKENEIIPTLKLSYDQLPSHLKQFFAYCSIFPKDYLMEKSRLIELWMAQGFIKLSSENECLEDVGDEYFMDLLWRSFFQIAKINDDLGNVIMCKMHDLMHDLAMSVAGSLITTLESKEKPIGEKTRHVLVIDTRGFSFVFQTFSSNASRIRTLLSLGQLWNFQELSTSSCEAIFSSLKFLRVLDLHERKLDLVQSSIGTLKHLRDLDLSWNKKIEKLPESISRLQNLHTLRLSGCKKLKELPRGITKLVNLRHLYIEDCDNLSYMPRGLGQLTNLRTLSNFEVHSDSTLKDSCRLSELNRLNGLRGELSIRGLRSGEDVALEYKSANLKEKEHLQVLFLSWRRENVNARDHEMPLEGLEPHPNLKKLYIDDYGGVRLSTWLSSLTNLVYLWLMGCRKLKYLPPLSRLPSLRRIFLQFLGEIEYMSDCSDNMNEFSSSFSSAFFPSLEEINFSFCRNLKGWWRRSDSYNVDVNTLALPLFPRLSKLKIMGCPMLTSLPMFPHLQEDLSINWASWKPVQQTLTNASSSSASSTPVALSSTPPLSKLKILTFGQVEDLETLPEDGLQNLVSLQRLWITNCLKLKCLSQGLQYLTAVCHLNLYHCPMLDLGNDEHGMQWKGLTSLISLQLIDLPKLVSFPMGLQHVTTLRDLSIADCSSLLDIPEWICNWASLEHFTIYGCSSLTSLPDAMSRLTSLKMFKIRDCPILLERCEEDRGEDWAKIAHIPKLDF